MVGATVQDGAAPEVKLVGEVGAQRIAVGRRHIGYDGEKLVFSAVEQ